MAKRSKAQVEILESVPVKAQRRNPTPRSHIELSPYNLGQIEALAARGLSMNEIAAYLGIAVSTFQIKLKDVPEAKEAFLRGRAIGHANVGGYIYDLANDDKVEDKIRLQAAKFYLATKAGWTPKIAMEHTGKEGEPIAIEHRVAALVANMSDAEVEAELRRLQEQNS